MSETKAEIVFDEDFEADRRAQILGSDLYSPMVKRSMQRFWDKCDQMDKAKTRRQGSGA